MVSAAYVLLFIPFFVTIIANKAKKERQAREKSERERRRKEARMRRKRLRAARRATERASRKQAEKLRRQRKKDKKRIATEERRLQEKRAKADADKRKREELLRKAKEKREAEKVRKKKEKLRETLEAKNKIKKAETKLNKKMKNAVIIEKNKLKEAKKRAQKIAEAKRKAQLKKMEELRKNELRRKLEKKQEALRRKKAEKEKKRLKAIQSREEKKLRNREVKRLSNLKKVVRKTKNGLRTKAARKLRFQLEEMKRKQLRQRKKRKNKRSKEAEKRRIARQLARKRAKEERQRERERQRRLRAEQKARDKLARKRKKQKLSDKKAQKKTAVQLAAEKKRQAGRLSHLKRLKKLQKKHKNKKQLKRAAKKTLKQKIKAIEGEASVEKKRYAVSLKKMIAKKHAAKAKCVAEIAEFKVKFSKARRRTKDSLKTLKRQALLFAANFKKSLKRIKDKKTSAGPMLHKRLKFLSKSEASAKQIYDRFLQLFNSKMAKALSDNRNQQVKLDAQIALWRKNTKTKKNDIAFLKKKYALEHAGALAKIKQIRGVALKKWRKQFWAKNTALIKRANKAEKQDQKRISKLKQSVRRNLSKDVRIIEDLIANLKKKHSKVLKAIPGEKVAVKLRYRRSLQAYDKRIKKHNDNLRRMSRERRKISAKKRALKKSERDPRRIRDYYARRGMTNSSGSRKAVAQLALIAKRNAHLHNKKQKLLLRQHYLAKQIKKLLRKRPKYERRYRRQRKAAQAKIIGDWKKYDSKIKLEISKLKARKIKATNKAKAYVRKLQGQHKNFIALQKRIRKEARRKNTGWKKYHSTYLAKELAKVTAFRASRLRHLEKLKRDLKISQKRGNLYVRLKRKQKRRFNKYKKTIKAGMKKEATRYKKVKATMKAHRRQAKMDNAATIKAAAKELDDAKRNLSLQLARNARLKVAARQDMKNELKELRRSKSKLGSTCRTKQKQFTKSIAELRRNNERQVRAIMARKKTARQTYKRTVQDLERKRQRTTSK